jgi:hypothetical protein
MYDELASVRGVVDLTSHKALDEIASFLSDQGYTITQRAGNSLTGERHSTGQSAEQSVPILQVAATPQPGGGVRIVIRGNDQQGLQERQAAFTQWSESLPKRQDEVSGLRSCTHKSELWGIPDW